MQTFHQTFRTRPILLSGSAVYESLYTSESGMTLRTARIIYDEASSPDAGVNIRIGKIGDPDFFLSFTSEPSKPAGFVLYLPHTDSMLGQDETLTVECDGGKTGNGIVSIQIELNHALTL